MMSAVKMRHARRRSSIKSCRAESKEEEQNVRLKEKYSRKFVY